MQKPSKRSQGLTDGLSALALGLLLAVSLSFLGQGIWSPPAEGAQAPKSVTVYYFHGKFR